MQEVGGRISAEKRPGDGAPVTDAAAGLFAGPGELRGRCRALDWGATPLGPVESWPEALRAAARLCLDSGFAMCVYAGPEHVLLYNDGFVRALGKARHPAALGRPAREVWAESWGQIESELAGVLHGGPPVHRVDQRFVLERDGVREETFWTYAFSPVREDDGAVVGVHHVVIETTSRVRAEAELHRGEARHAFLLALSDALRPLADPIEIQNEAARVLGRHLGASRASYAEVEEDDAHFTVHRDYTHGVPSYAGRYLLDSFGPGFVNDMRAGRTVLLADAERDGRVSEAERAVLAAGTIHAFIGVPLVKGGRLAAVFSLHHSAPHTWSRDEVTLVEETAERTWATVERARAEAALRAADARYRTLFELIDEGFVLAEVIHDAEGRPVDALYLEGNPAASRLTGVPDFTRRRLSEVAPWAEPYWLELYDRVARTGVVEHLERQVALRERWYDCYIIRVEDARGAHDGAARIAVIFQDITARGHAEAALRESEARLALIFTQATVGLSEVSADGRFLKNNAELRRILGRTPEEMALLSVADVTHPESLPASLVALRRVLETGESVSVEKRYLRPDGTPVWAESRITRLGGSEGVAFRLLVVTVDLTARREAEAALRQSEEASRALAAQAGQRAELAQQLVGIVSHDLGSPLAALRLSAEALSSSPLDERQMAALGRIRTSAEWAMRLTKDLLDFTQVRLGGGLRLHPHALDLEACVRRVLEEVQASFPGRPMRLHCEGNARGVWDGDRMAQVVTNLVNNAAKYSPPDTPISVRLYTQRNRMVLEVHNQGRPIPSAVRERLFEPMRRGTLDVDPTGRSVGLGLFIVKHIVDAHGGTLQVKSSARQGITFTVRLPRVARVKA